MFSFSTWLAVSVHYWTPCYVADNLMSNWPKFIDGFTEMCKAIWGCGYNIYILIKRAKALQRGIFIAVHSNTTTTTILFGVGVQSRDPLLSRRNRPGESHHDRAWRCSRSFFRDLWDLVTVAQWSGNTCLQRRDIRMGIWTQQKTNLFHHLKRMLEFCLLLPELSDSK